MNPQLLTPETMTYKGEELLNKIKKDFIGLDTKYTLVNGDKTERIYLDSTASTLMMGVAYRASSQFLKHYSNTHSRKDKIIAHISFACVISIFHILRFHMNFMTKYFGLRK